MIDKMNCVAALRDRLVSVANCEGHRRYAKTQYYSHDFSFEHQLCCVKMAEELNGKLAILTATNSYQLPAYAQPAVNYGR